MDGRIPDIKPMGMEPWIITDGAARESKTISPVPQNEGGSFNKMSDDSSNAQKESSYDVSPEEAKRLAQGVQNYLDDLNIGVNFDIEDKTGEVVVKVVNRKTNEIIRQIPAEALVKLHEHLRDLVGVLFNGQA